jgi:hypothetical protein
VRQTVSATLWVRQTASTKSVGETDSLSVKSVGEADGLSQLVGETDGQIHPVGEADGQSQPVGEADGLCNGDGAGFLGEEVSDVIHLLVVLPSSSNIEHCYFILYYILYYFILYTKISLHRDEDVFVKNIIFLVCIDNSISKSVLYTLYIYLVL